MTLIQKIAAAALGYATALRNEFVKALADDRICRIPDPLSVLSTREKFEAWLEQQQEPPQPGCCPLFACPHCGETLICHTAALEWAPQQ